MAYRRADMLFSSFQPQYMETMVQAYHHACRRDKNLRYFGVFQRAALASMQTLFAAYAVKV